MVCKLSVNVNAVAQLRNRRDLPWPSVVGLSRIALEAGAYGITVHPRPDERHIRRSDVPEIAAMIKVEFPDREFNIEGYPETRLLDIVKEIRPDQVTLVPDDPAQATSDHGWDFDKHHNFLRDVVADIKALGCRVSLFVDAEISDAEKAAQTGTDRIELYTGPYGSTHDDPAAAKRELGKLVETGKQAVACGLEVNAGHDLTLENLPPLVAAFPALAEVSIGHCITADALLYGMAGAVTRYRAACADPVGS